MAEISNQYENRLGTDRMLPLVFRMALPSVTAQIVNLLYNIVDRVFIGRIPGIGTDALAGVGVTGSIIILISAFSMIVGGGGAPLASIALGQGRRERAGRILGNGFVMLVLFSAVTSTLAYIFMEPLLMLTGASENTIVYATDYLEIYLAGTVFVQISTGLNSFISAQGRPGIAMLSTVIGAATNLILDPVFIFALGMGVKGAALATIISQALSALWVLQFLFSSRASLRLDPGHMKIERKVVLAIFSLGVAPFVMASTESIVGFVLNGSLKHYGDIYVSTLTVLQSVMMFGSVPITGIHPGSQLQFRQGPDRQGKILFQGGGSDHVLVQFRPHASHGGFPRRRGFLLHRRSGIDRTCQGNGTLLSVRFHDFRSAESLPEHVHCPGTGQDIPFHCIAQESVPARAARHHIA